MQDFENIIAENIDILYKLKIFKGFPFVLMRKTLNFTKNEGS